MQFSEKSVISPANYHHTINKNQSSTNVILHLESISYLIYWSNCLSFNQHSKVLILELYIILNSCGISHVILFFVKLVLIILCCLHFYITSEICVNFWFWMESHRSLSMWELISHYQIFQPKFFNISYNVSYRLIMCIIYQIERKPFSSAFLWVLSAT